MMNGRLGICGQAGMVHARRGSVSSVGTTKNEKWCSLEYKV
jgi:hypothetical protein